MSNKSPRKELTSLRLEPKNKYLAEIAARVQRRSLTNFIEQAIMKAVEEVELENGKTVKDMELELWSVNPDKRLQKLAELAPELLTFDEELELEKKENEKR